MKGEIGAMDSKKGWVWGGNGDLVTKNGDFVVMNWEFGQSGGRNGDPG